MWLFPRYVSIMFPKESLLIEETRMWVATPKYLMWTRWKGMYSRTLKDLELFLYKLEYESCCTLYFVPLVAEHWQLKCGFLVSMNHVMWASSFWALFLSFV